MAQMHTGRKYSDYYEQLDASAKARYQQKLNSFGEDVDNPYTFDYGKNVADMPEIEYPDIYNFLINTPSPVSKEELKAYESLEGYKYLVAGWVGDLSVHSISTSGDKVVIQAKVRHSKTVSASPLRPWVAAAKGGTVLCAHCTCMAGLGEACSHIAALLFAAEAHTK